MRMKCNFSVVGGALAVAVICASGWGQMQVQQNNPLDANPLVGSGGSNEPVEGYVPVNGNDIVTGNVGGLKYFHGPTTAVVAGPGGVLTTVQAPSLGTFSPYTFQGQQGSASFNNFARQSSGGAQANIGATRTFYLPSSTVSTGGGSLYSSPYGSGFESSRIPRYSASATSAAGDASQSGPLSAEIQFHQFSATPANPGAAGVSGALTSPLFGVRPNPLSVDLSAQPNGANTDAQQNGTSGSANGSGKGSGNGTGRNANDTGTDSGGSRRTSRFAPDKSTDQTGPTNGLAAPGDSTNGTNNGAGGSDNTAHANPQVSETYRSLLQRLETESAKADAKAKAAIAANETKNPKGNARGQTAPGDLTTPGNGRVPEIDPLTGRPRKVAPGSGDLLNGGGTGRDAGQRTGEGVGRGVGGTTYRPRANVMSRSRVENIPEGELQAGKEVPPLKTLAETPQGAKPTSFESLMKNAEGLLKSGKYMEAADAYQGAMTTEPDNALAVIGRAQAELGAGMYESAAGDLQTVFARKPALMGVHYPIGDFIPAERQNYLIKDLQSLSTNPGPGNTASFLLCYMYYNTGRGDDVAGELGRWGNRAWRNSWEGVAEKAWK